MIEPGRACAAHRLIVQAAVNLALRCQISEQFLEDLSFGVRQPFGILLNTWPASSTIQLIRQAT